MAKHRRVTKKTLKRLSAVGSSDKAISLPGSALPMQDVIDKAPPPKKKKKKKIYA